MKAKRNILTKSAIAAVGILVAASSVSNDVIKIPHLEVRDYVYKTIKDVGATVSLVVDKVTKFSSADTERGAAAVNLDGYDTGAMTMAVAHALSDDAGRSHFGGALLTSAAPGLVDHQSQNGSGGAGGNSAHAPVLINYGGNLSHPVPAPAPSGATPTSFAPQTVLGIDPRVIPAFLLDVLPKPKVKPLVAAAKPCATGDKCSVEESAEVAMRLEVGDPFGTSVAGDSTNTVAAMNLRAEGVEDLTTAMIRGSVSGIGADIGTSGIGISGPGTPVDAEGQNVKLAAVVPTAIAAPQTLPLLGLGLGCLFWFSRRRVRV